MGQQQVLNILKKYPGKKMTSKEIQDKYGEINYSTLNRSLLRLAVSKFIKRKLYGNKYVYWME